MHKANAHDCDNKTALLCTPNHQTTLGKIFPRVGAIALEQMYYDWRRDLARCPI